MNTFNQRGKILHLYATKKGVSKNQIAITLGRHKSTIGRESCGHEAIAKTLDCGTYFAKPYHSWQRGLNENHNGLLRQYFPKKEPLDKVTPKMRLIVQLQHLIIAQEKG